MQAKAGQVGALVSWVEYVDLVGGEDSTMSCLLSMSWKVKTEIIDLYCHSRHYMH